MAIVGCLQVRSCWHGMVSPGTCNFSVLTFKFFSLFKPSSQLQKQWLLFLYCLRKCDFQTHFVVIWRAVCVLLGSWWQTLPVPGVDRQVERHYQLIYVLGVVIDNFWWWYAWISSAPQVTSYMFINDFNKYIECDTERLCIWKGFGHHSVNSWEFYAQDINCNISIEFCHFLNCGSLV